jgi:transposase
MDLTDDQWKIISDILPKDPVRPDGRGRPWSDRRQVLNGALWILRTGAQWEDMPDRYGAHTTVHRRFQNWVRSGVMERVLLAIAQDLKDRGGLDLRECFIDGTFAPAKKGGAASGRRSGEKALKSWQLPTAMVFLSPYAQRVLPLLK